MGINVMIVILMYLLVLVFSYKVVILINSKDDKAEKIVNKAFENAFFILCYCLLIVYTLIVLPHIVLDFQTTAFLLLISKYISVLTLGGSIFMLSRMKKYE